MRLVFLRLTGVMIVVVLTLAGRSPATRAAFADRVVVEENVEATMRDGVVLRADIYRPDAPGRFPALLQRTPYSKRPQGAREAFSRLASEGFVVVSQDTRGRYMSDGVARPHDEAADGYDSVEWVATLPYVNGAVGMFGGSYLATTQLLAASLQPPHLRVLFPSASYASRYDMVFQGGAFYLADGLSWNVGQARDVRRRRETPDVIRSQPIEMSGEESRLLRERWMPHLPLKTVDVPKLRELAPGYFEMLAHPSFDEYWQTFNIAARHHLFETPALHLTGWYDTLLTGTLHNFAGLRAHARSPVARANQRLIVGPWTHARPNKGTTRIGDVDFGSSAGLDSEDLRLRWFRAWLQNGDPAAVVSAPVRLFIMGENRWRDEQEWPLARARPTQFYLASQGRANTLNGDGRLVREEPAGPEVDRYTYDPSNPVRTIGQTGYSRAPGDQRDIEKREDVLVYSSDPLSAPLEVTGPISLVLWAASSAPDTDFTAKLVDVFPDGTARALSDGILRVRYREGPTAPILLTPGQATRLVIDVGATANVFLTGHRIRLEVSSSNFPRFDRNPNTAAAFGEESHPQPAHQTIFHDGPRPSHLVLPVVPRPDLSIESR